MKNVTYNTKKKRGANKNKQIKIKQYKMICSNPLKNSSIANLTTESGTQKTKYCIRVVLIRICLV
jgi:hypothetical protein